MTPLLLLVVAAVVADRPARAQSVVYGAPITITQGGTYSGNWQSLDPSVPAVRVSTTQPVVIEGSNIRGEGDLIKAAGLTDVTVRDTRGYGLNPNEAGKYPGRFFRSEGFANVILRNNYMEGTSGVHLLDYRGNGTASNSVRILENQAKNIDGRLSDGTGGFSQSEFYRVQFVQLDKVKRLVGAEIGWNEVVNDPYRSRVEDVINVFKSSGSSGSPLRIHDNYVQGAYSGRPSSDTFSGGGIITDGNAPTLEEASAYVSISDNQVISTSNYGIAIAAGHDNEISNNRVVSSGYLADGTFIAAQNVGIYVRDPHNNALLNPSTYYNNRAHDNEVGWIRTQTGTRNDFFFPVSGSNAGNNAHLPGPITRDTEAAELARWNDKLASATVKVGPRTQAAPAPAPAPAPVPAPAPAPAPEPAPAPAVNTAPTTSLLRPSSGSTTRDRTPNIAAVARDAQTELAKPNLRLTLDGRRVGTGAFSYNRNTDRVSYTPAQKLGPGNHTVTLVTHDAQGLATKKSWRFRVVN